MDQDSELVRKIGKDGALVTVAGELNFMKGSTPATSIQIVINSIAISASGNLLIAHGNLISVDDKGNITNITAPYGPLPVEGALAVNSGINAIGVTTLEDGSVAVSDASINTTNYGAELWQIRADGTLHAFASAPASYSITFGADSTILASGDPSIYSYSSSDDRTIFAGKQV